MNTWRHVFIGQRSITSLRTLYDTRAGNQKIARNVRGVLAQCPAAFRDVLGPRVDACTRDMAILHAYELYFLELKMHWRTPLVPDAADDGDPSAHEESARELVRLIQQIRDSDACTRADWDYAVPLDDALGTERLLVWCTLLREIATTEVASEQIADAQDVARSLLSNLETRLEKLRRSRAALSYRKLIAQGLRKPENEGRRGWLPLAPTRPRRPDEQLAARPHWATAHHVVANVVWHPCRQPGGHEYRDAVSERADSQLIPSASRYVSVYALCA
ncbi:hypothetical protein PsYK624_136800 [Phanerochaete sordida]|uniref:Uncharacterized protein n=1 Tax=Phanerochaete sordida TaxID=48140 RepID=A0A9P3GLF2_9APHY|nr:hypothetical protein PsYK624_136800 [Phanerochaete sordida]